MANLVISNVCNLNCDYCFSRDFLQGNPSSTDQSFISEQAFRARLDFLERSDIEDVRLIGGEPGLHPRFAELIAASAKRFPRIVVFTNGLLNDTALVALEALPPERLTVLVNMAASDGSGVLNERQENLRQRALERLGRRVILGYTISRIDFDCDDLIPFIQENNCRKSIRLGLAQPSLQGSNVFLHPKQYPLVGTRIVAFTRLAASQGIRVEFDCSFVRCMFSDRDFEQLQDLDAYAEWRCNPVLDIDLHDRVSHCFPLAGRFVTAFESQTTASDLHQWFAESTRPYRLAGIYKECSSCHYKLSGACTGGCLAATLLRFREVFFRFTEPAG
jgi:hypothetical protein